MYRSVFAFAAAATLTACTVENEIVDDLPTLVLGSYQDTDMLYEPPEEPRFYLVDFGYAPAVSDWGDVLLYDWETADVYLWTEYAGVEWLTTTGAWYNSVDDISADGLTIIGSYGRYDAGEATQAATWTRTDGWTKLGALPDTLDCPMQSAGWSLTDDGATAVGLAFEGCSAFGFRWDVASGMQPLEQLANGGNRASRVSGNGALTVGFAQGNSARTPAVWYPDGSGEVLDPAFTGEFYGVDGDGEVAVGKLGTKAFKWTPADGHTFLGTLGEPGESSSTAQAVCGASDELILGSDTLSGGIATAWTEETGLIAMTDYLESLGIELPADTRLTSAHACSPDKRYLVGNGGVGSDVGTWVAVLPEHVF